MAAAVAQRPSAPPPPKERFQGVQKESAGYRLMSAMGWREGEGLGAAKQGIKTHIRVKKKFENWGVGAVSTGANAAQRLLASGPVGSTQPACPVALFPPASALPPMKR